jgi:hypothetical protein
MCSILTPQASGHIFLKTSKKPEAASAIRSSRTWQRIVPVGLRRIGAIEVDHIGSPPGRDLRCDTVNQIAMRVDQRDAVPAINVLERHRFDKG